ncbi:N,N'-diacetylchitobiose phosphorylase [Clostridia bacterium]|nr:N,N'-diacetylchitobiose phosphorylase [Clostridia bacterium]
MNYGHFDDANREYVITRPDVPVSWTNYLGTGDMGAVVSHNAGGYIWYKSPQYHRITRFRPNSVPLDRPGHYIYLRDDDTGEYWSVSWQPVGGDVKDYECRHGLGYSTFISRRNGIQAAQTLFIPVGEPTEIWDLKLRNTCGKPRRLSVFSYCEFSYHHIDMDNQNFQMSLYASGASYADSVIEYDLYYEQFGYQYFTSSFTPDSFDCERDVFLGAYRTETNPIGVERGELANSQRKCYNSCGSLHKRITLQPGEDARLWFLLGEGKREAGIAAREKYSSYEEIDAELEKLAEFWDNRLSTLQIKTPHKGMNSMINTWTLYQADVNVLFSRFASFVEVGGRTGLGYRDTAQDAMCIPSADPQGCKWRLVQLLHGQTSKGYGLHLFSPDWFIPEERQESFKSPTVVPVPDKASMIHGIDDVCSDDALWLIPAVCEYVAETGDTAFFDRVIPFADEGEGTVYEHLKRSLDFSAQQIGAHGVCKGLRADWNDCLNLGGGESAMVSFLHYWALTVFVDAAKYLGKTEDAEKYAKLAKATQEICERELWDGKWYLRGFTRDGRKIGSDENPEGKVHMECNTLAVLSGASIGERGRLAMDAVDEYLYTPYGLVLNSPSFRTIDDGIGFVSRVYPGIKENGAIFSHPNPWAWIAECKLGRGDRAMKFYDALCPALQNDNIETRFAEPYSYCQFVGGPDSDSFGRANHPWMTGSAGWAYFAATSYILGVRPDYDALVVDPCVPSDWKEFKVTRVFRGATYDITVQNPKGLQKGKPVRLPIHPSGSVTKINIVMEEQ